MSLTSSTLAEPRSVPAAGRRSSGRILLNVSAIMLVVVGTNDNFYGLVGCACQQSAVAPKDADGKSETM